MVQGNYDLETAADHLRHMVGKDSDSPGYRNHFCANIGSDDWNTLNEMAKDDLVSPGRVINGGRDQYWHATHKGCRVAGLTGKQICDAMS